MSRGNVEQQDPLGNSRNSLSQSKVVAGLSACSTAGINPATGCSAIRLSCPETSRIDAIATTLQPCVVTERLFN